MKRQLHETYRRLRQREGITLGEMVMESDIPKPALLAWELGRAKLLRCDLRRYALAMKSLVRRRAMRTARREAVPGRAELRAKPIPPTVSFANLGRIDESHKEN